MEHDTSIVRSGNASHHKESCGWHVTQCIYCTS